MFGSSSTTRMRWAGAVGAHGRSSDPAACGVPECFLGGRPERPCHLVGVPRARRPHLPAAVYAFALCTFAIGTTEFLGIGLLPEIAAGLGVSHQRAGALISAYAGGVVVGRRR